MKLIASMFVGVTLQMIIKPLFATIAIFSAMFLVSAKLYGALEVCKALWALGYLISLIMHLKFICFFSCMFQIWVQRSVVLGSILFIPSTRRWWLIWRRVRSLIERVRSLTLKSFFLVLELSEVSILLVFLILMRSHIEFFESLCHRHRWGVDSVGPRRTRTSLVWVWWTIWMVSPIITKHFFFI